MRIIIASLFIILSMYINASWAALDFDVSEPVLEISTGFDGDTLTLFGSIDTAGDIVILLKGPSKNTVIRRKVDVLGLWVHARSVEFMDVPQYYNVASSKSIFEITDEANRLKYNLGINSLRLNPKDRDLEVEKKSRFQEALIQDMQLNGLYSLTPNAVDFINDRLFKTRIYMPSNVPVGNYEIEAFLFQNGQMVATQSHPFIVKQVGLTANIHDFALKKPFLYGVLIIIIAILSSLLAILLLRRE